MPNSSVKWDKRICCVFSGPLSFLPLSVGASPPLGMALVFKGNFDLRENQNYP